MLGTYALGLVIRESIAGSSGGLISSSPSAIVGSLIIGGVQVSKMAACHRHYHRLCHGRRAICC